LSLLAELLSPTVCDELRSLVRDEVAAALAQRDRERAAKRWASADETAEQLGISRGALYARVRRGRLPASAVRHSGRAVLFDLHAIDTFLEESA